MTSPCPLEGDVDLITWLRCLPAFSTVMISPLRYLELNEFNEIRRHQHIFVMSQIFHQGATFTTNVHKQKAGSLRTKGQGWGRGAGRLVRGGLADGG